MAVKLSTALQYVEHSGWGSGSPILGKRAVEEALVEIENMPKWRWLQPPSVMLTLVAQQDYVDLPADFRDLIEINATEGLQGRFFMVDIGEINQLRTYQQNDSATTYRGAIEWADSTDPDGGAPIPRIAIYPMPTDTKTDWLTLSYRKKIAVPATDSIFIPMPDFMDPLFFQVIDAVTKGWAFDDLASPKSNPGRTRTQRMTEILLGPTYLNARRRDGSAQPTFGPMRNVSVPNRFFGPKTLATTVAPPS